MPDSEAPRSVDAKTTVTFTSLDIVMLLWGAETVTWADEENQVDWDRAIVKLEKANLRLNREHQQKDAG